MEMTYDDWWERYRPVKNHLDPNAGFNGCAFETFGKELAEVLRVANSEPGRVWTMVDGDDEQLVIGSGYHLVNRLAYFITEVPCTDDNVAVPVDF